MKPVDMNLQGKPKRVREKRIQELKKLNPLVVKEKDIYELLVLTNERLEEMYDLKGEW